MYTKVQLLETLQSAGIQKTDTLMVHSSMKSIGSVDGGADTVLDALNECVENGLLLLPTHTWNSINEKHSVFDLEKEPSCVGILTNMFRKRPNVLRSLHPTHSIGVTGKRAASYIANEDLCQTPCPREGCWGRLYDEHAKILLIGIGFERNTFIHSVEEWCNVPHRLAENPVHFQIKLPDGQMKNCHSHPHYNEKCPDISRNFVKLEKLALQHHAAQKIQFGDASCFLCDAVKLADLVQKCLTRDIDLFGNATPLSDEWYS